MNTQDWLTWAVSQTHSTPPEGHERVGTLELAPHQVHATDRLVSIVEEFGGVLLADSVGMGKTRVAIAAAARLARTQLRQKRAVIVCAPARVLPQWRTACDKGGLTNVELVSHHAASRHALTPQDSVMIVDEAHRFRKPSTRRYDWLSEVATHSDVILLSATPIANSVWDLFHLLSIFLRDDALRSWVGKDLRDAFEAAEVGSFDLTQVLTQICVRRVSATDFDKPKAKLQVLSYNAPSDELWLWKNLDSTIRSLGFELLREDWPTGLLRQYISRRWEAGPAALLETLNYLTEFHERWLQVTRNGGTLDRSEFKSLFGEEHRQNVLPFMFGDSTTSSSSPCSAAVEADLRRLEALRARADQASKHSGVAEAIMRLVEGSPEKLLIFTSYVPAAEGLFRMISSQNARLSVGLLTGSSTRVTGLGRIGPQELLQRFAPKAQGVAPLRSHQEVDILVATDCISEGTNLQDCSRIVLADLPYSPLTVEQRVGRLLRPGSTASEVTIYLPRPADWNDTLGLRARLLSKMKAADSAGTAYTDIWNSTQPRQQNPLQILTDLDSLVANHHPTEVPRTLRFDGDEQFALVLLRVFVGTNTHHRLLTILGDTWVPLEVSMPRIICTFDRSAEVSAAPSPKVIEALVKELETKLRAASHAPARIPMDSPQYRAWKLLRDHNTKPQTLTWNETRRRLLEPMKCGNLRRLEAAIQISSAAVSDLVMGFPTRVEGRTRVEIIGSLFAGYSLT